MIDVALEVEPTDLAKELVGPGDIAAFLEQQERALVSRANSSEKVIGSRAIGRSSEPATGALNSGRGRVPTSGAQLPGDEAPLPLFVRFSKGCQSFDGPPCVAAPCGWRHR